MNFTLTVRRLLWAAVVLWIGKILVGLAWEYRNYFPPNFDADFLLGRDAYFWGVYSGAFYVHLMAGPATLACGALLMSESFRQRFPAWHRRIGRMQVFLVLCLLVPSGLWMAWYAATGMVAGAGLAALAIATAGCISLGWRAAVQRKFQNHERWMQRTFVLLCSAVVIRLLGGLATVWQLDQPWIYTVACWISWLVPWLVLECVLFLDRRTRRLVARS